MGWPNLAGMIKVVVTYGFGGKPSVNVHFVLQDTPTTPVVDAQLLLAANAFHAAWADNWETRAADTWTVDTITALDYSRDSGHEIETSLTLPIVGGSVALALPSSVSGVVSQRTHRTGRSYRGRNYVPGMTQSSVGANLMNSDLITDLGLLYSDLRDNLVTSNMTHVVYSLFAGGEERVVPVPTLITGTIVNNRVDTQRRRLPI